MLFPIKAYIQINISTFEEKSLRGKIEIFWENHDPSVLLNQHPHLE